MTFGLGYRVRSPRIDVAVEPYPGRFTHHVLVSGAGEIDDELMGWVKEAAVFAGDTLSGQTKGCEANGFVSLSIFNKHVAELETLVRPKDAPSHKDPFDRLLLAQAKAASYR